MITRIRLRNFQAHQDSSLALHPGINVITGPNDQGKTSIMRAVVWAVFNSFRGFAFRREGAPKDAPTSVTIATDSGDVVTRLRRGSDNQYLVNKVVLSAVGGAVPPQVKNALRLSPHNIQGQHEGHFLLGSAPGAVASAINQAAGFKIDDLFSNLNKMAARTRAKISEHRDDLEKFRERLESFPDLTGMEAECAELLTAIEAVRGKGREMIATGKLVSRYHEAKKTLEAHRGKDLSGIEREIKSLEASRDQVVSLEKRVQEIDALIYRGDRAARGLERAKESAELANKELDALLRTIKVCPTCGQTIRRRK